MESVESLCNRLARSKHLSSDAVRTIHNRWKAESKDGADDLARFSKWLVGNGFITDFQFGVLSRGFADLLFLDDYKLLERIGQGRMAGVYKAVHKLGQIVAVKVLPPSKAKQAQTLARFQREARLSMRLKHANVVRTFQVGKTKNDLHYIVMEYIDGETLEDVLQRRIKLPLPEALQLIVQAFQGLVHLDEEGMIHRDLKPGNLMLIPQAPETTLSSVVKILDIGLGRALFDEGTPGAEMAELTSEGSLLGTPLYMAPEQARSAHAADIRADIYSLGCVLYHALTGQPPFPDTSVVRQLVRHATEAMRPLSDFTPDLPAGVQAVMDRLLAKDPAQRYATPKEALKALRGLQQGVKAPPAPPQAEASMDSYLQWLKKAGPDEEPEAAFVAATPEPAVAPKPIAKPVVPVAKPFAPPPAQAAAPVREPAPVPVAASAKWDATPFTDLSTAKPGEGKQSGSWLSIMRRDLIAAGIGAAVVIVIDVLLLIVWLLTR